MVWDGTQSSLLCVKGEARYGFLCKPYNAGMDTYKWQTY